MAHKILQHYQQRVEIALKSLLPPESKVPTELHRAMRYGVLHGGKRIRAALVYATGECMGANPAILDRVSAAVEMMHAFSLIHDDLPALDNDDLRRGKPTVHKAFGEATAILAGDALQTYAIQVLTKLDPKKIKPIFTLEIINILSHAILEMERGEELDILMTKKVVSLSQLKKTYQLKTGCLLTSCVLMGALAAQCQKKNTLVALKKFGDWIGLAFQIQDDIIGIESTTDILGKQQGSDATRGKPTYPSLLGIEEAKKEKERAYKNAMRWLQKSLLKCDKLVAIADFVIQRQF